MAQLKDNRIDSDGDTVAWASYTKSTCDLQPVREGTGAEWYNIMDREANSVGAKFLEYRCNTYLLTTHLLTMLLFGLDKGPGWQNLSADRKDTRELAEHWSSRLALQSEATTP